MIRRGIKRMPIYLNYLNEYQLNLKIIFSKKEISKDFRILLFYLLQSKYRIYKGRILIGFLG